MASDAAVGLGILILIVVILVLIAIIVLMITAFWVWMIVDVLRRDMDDGHKILWVVLMLIFGIIVSIVYYFAIKLPGDKRGKHKK